MTAPLPRGANFTRKLISLALAKVEDGNPLEIARSRWGAASSVAQQLEKANKPAGVNAAGNWAVDFTPTPGDNSAVEFFGAVEARSIPGMLPGLRRVPFHVAGLGIAAGTGVDWVKEGFAVPINNPVTYRIAGLPALKLAVATVVSEEMLRDSDPRIEDVIRRDLLNSGSYAISAAFIDPANTGTASTKPASVTSGQASDSPASTLSDTGDIVEELMSNQDYAGDLEKSVLIMHPATGARFNSAAHPLVGARGGEMFGFPVIVSSAVPTNIVVLIDPTAVLFPSENDGEITVSTKGAVEMSDTPTGKSANYSDGVVATSLVSLFQTNSVGVMLTRRANWAMAKPNCVSYVNIAVG
jgi:Phage capsid family